VKVCYCYCYCCYYYYYYYYYYYHHHHHYHHYHILSVFCLTGLFFQRRLTPTYGGSYKGFSKKNLWGLLLRDFYRPSALSVTQPTTSKH